LGAAAKIRLIGVVMGEQRGVFAIVEEQTSKNQALYRLHDRIPDLGEVTDIQRNSIVIRQGNLEELVGLSLPDKPFAPGNSASTPPSPALSASRTPAASPLLKQVVDRREVEQAMNDLPKLMTQARAVPNMVNGAINGFRLDYIAPSSFYEKIGVQTGDVLQRVNGVDIRDPGTILSLLQQLKNEEVVKLDIIRNNQRSTVTYELR
jgi:general secretion pathway protein C